MSDTDAGAPMPEITSLDWSVLVLDRRVDSVEHGTAIHATPVALATRPAPGTRLRWVSLWHPDLAVGRVFANVTYENDTTLRTELSRSVPMIGELPADVRALAIHAAAQEALVLDRRAIRGRERLRLLLVDLVNARTEVVLDLPRVGAFDSHWLVSLGTGDWALVASDLHARRHRVLRLRVTRAERDDHGRHVGPPVLDVLAFVEGRGEVVGVPSSSLRGVSVPVQPPRAATWTTVGYRLLDGRGRIDDAL